MLAMGCGWGRDMDTLPGLRSFGVLGTGVHHLPQWGHRSYVAASATCLPPPLFYCTIHPAFWGSVGDSAAPSLLGGWGKAHLLTVIGTSPPEASDFKLRAGKTVRGACWVQERRGRQQTTPTLPKPEGLDVPRGKFQAPIQPPGSFKNQFSSRPWQTLLGKSRAAL